MLKVFINSYSIFITNIQVPSVETSQKGRSYVIFGNPRRVIRFYRREKIVEFFYEMGSSRPML
jgi:hypothetical protein